MIAIFRNKIFQVDVSKIYTFNDFSHSALLQTDAQEVDGKKPSTYIKGQGLDTMSFSLSLEERNGINPRQEWENWQQILAQGVPDIFVLGGKPIGENKWLLKTITPSNVRIDNSGHIQGLTLALEFEEYVRPGKKEAGGSSGSKSPGIKSKVNVQDEISAILLSPDEKEANKRTNTNMRR
ncbi:MAG: phage tail protein [Peptococcaceae bacterium]|jgi:hypothetical protein|nr:phage tail protein [Peptococcaceae bacterium]MDH7525294.1 phage tail protein [Peptococcaceae bacterium]